MTEAPDIRQPERAVTGAAKGCSLHSLVPQPFYDVDGITIYCGDNRALLPMMPACDLLLTDPPYGIGADDRKRIMSRGSKANPRDYGDGGWDNETACYDDIETAMAKTRWQIIWGGNHYPLPQTAAWLVWDKMKTIPNDFADGELAWTNTEKSLRIFRYLWNGYWQGNMKEREQRYHPTQKPACLMTWCIGKVPDAKTILDPWMGSGTTLVAAKSLGLRAIGIEINETYCRAAVDRLAQGVLGLENVRFSDSPSGSVESKETP